MLIKYKTSFNYNLIPSNSPIYSKEIVITYHF